MGFSIAGGKGSPPFKDGYDGIFISRITEGGLAHRDGKILVGDKVLAVSAIQQSERHGKSLYSIFKFSFSSTLSSKINGVDIQHGTHDSAVLLLTDHQRFVRLVVQREIKGPLEPPQSPHSPSYLKGLSPSGYMANRPGYKRPIGSIGAESPVGDNGKYITNISPVVPQQKYPSSQQSPVSPTNDAFGLHQQPTKTNGIEAQPVPAPRRLTSQSSFGSAGVNGQSVPPSQNGNRSDDEDAQVNINRSIASSRDKIEKKTKPSCLVDID